MARGELVDLYLRIDKILLKLLINVSTLYWLLKSSDLQAYIGDPHQSFGGVPGGPKQLIHHFNHFIQIVRLLSLLAIQEYRSTSS